MAFKDFFASYVSELIDSAHRTDPAALASLCVHLMNTITTGNSLFICGNGGSAANANHIANDFHFSFQDLQPYPLKVISLSANTALITCIANDNGYDRIYSDQVNTLGKAGDSLIVLSGSGTSTNIIKALEAAHIRHMTTISVTGYSGGEAHKMANIAINLPVPDMQFSEDSQLILFHSIIRYIRPILFAKRA